MMINLKRLISILLIAAVIILPSCSKKFGSNDSELIIGVEDISAEINPLYAFKESDLAISSQIFATVQRMNSRNEFVNYCGGISYELVGENQVKYTVTLRDDLFFSDGTNVKIDDLIFFYHLICDATYDGVYSDWHLNDIVGINEYYYDDVDFNVSVSEIETELEENYSPLNISKSDFVSYLIANALEGNFVGGLDSLSPSGKTWREYFKEIEYTEELEKLGDNPTDMELLKVAARAEAENNPLEYSPQNYYREILMGEYLGSNYSDGADVTSISGIQKVNDYSCTILFNSRNINAISEINVPIISRAVYESDYVKGNASVIREKSSAAIGSGPYVLSKTGNNEISLSVNEHYFGERPDFASLRFVDLKAEGIDPVEAVNAGDVDIISVTATEDVLNSFDSDKIRTSVSNVSSYVSVFFNSRTLEIGQRKALAGFCNFNKLLTEEIGRNYTAVYMPMSIRFEEYPSDIIAPVYSENTYSNYLLFNPEGISNVTAACTYPENSLEYSILKKYKDLLAKNGITMEIILADSSLLDAAIASGKVDLWIEAVPDGATCDKYDYYNSAGLKNKTGLNDAEIDTLTASLRGAVGFSDRQAIIKSLLNLVMAQAVECPLYQLQNVTAYNVKKISPDSFGDNFDYDGFTYVLPFLKRK